MRRTNLTYLHLADREHLIIMVYLTALRKIKQSCILRVSAEIQIYILWATYVFCGLYVP